MAQHKGSAVVEIYQNCNVFNDGAFDSLTDKATKLDTTVRLVHGKPVVFGAKNDKGIRLNGMTPEVVTIGENGITEADLLVWDETNAMLSFMMAGLGPEFPVPLGVFRAVQRPVHHELELAQMNTVLQTRGEGDIECSPDTPAACDGNRQDWAVLLKLKPQAQLARIGPVTPPSFLPRMPQGQQGPTCCVNCVLGSGVPRCPAPGEAKPQQPWLPPQDSQ